MTSPLIWLPKTKEILLPEARTGVSGHFVMRSWKHGKIVRERAFDNLLLNQGLNRMGSAGGSGQYRYVQVGIGTTTPAVTDVGLANRIAGFDHIDNNSGYDGSDPANPFSWLRIRYLSAIGAVVGNLTEIGAAYSATGNTLFSRALILDGGGNPTTFPVAADEQLEVFYEIRHYPNLTDNVANILLGSTPYTATTRPIAITNYVTWQPPSPTNNGNGFAATYTSVALYTGGLAAPTAGNPTGSYANNQCTGSPTTAAYVDGNFYRESSFSWNISVGNNAANRTAVLSWTSCRYQVEYDPTFSKSNTQTLVLNQRVSWARR